MLQRKAMHNKSNILKQFDVILCRPSHGGNIGSTARAMKTMGLTKLHLVQPKKFPTDEAYALAAGADDVLDSAIICDSIEEAMEEFKLVYSADISFRDVADKINAFYNKA